MQRSIPLLWGLHLALLLAAVVAQTTGTIHSEPHTVCFVLFLHERDIHRFPGKRERRWRKKREEIEKHCVVMFLIPGDRGNSRPRPARDEKVRGSVVCPPIPSSLRKLW